MTHKAQLRPQTNWSRSRKAGHTTAGLILRAQHLLPDKAAAPALAPCRVTGAGRTPLHTANTTQDYHTAKKKKKTFHLPGLTAPELSSHSNTSSTCQALPHSPWLSLARLTCP